MEIMNRLISNGGLNGGQLGLNANKNNRLKAKGKLHNDNSFLTKPFDFTKKRKKYFSNN